MFRFVIYKNSVLATIFSMFGTACAAMGVIGLVQDELGVFPGIGVIAAGFGLMFLAGMISGRKDIIMQETQQAAAANARAGSAQSAYAQPPVGPAQGGKPVRKSLMCAGIFFLLAALLSLWALTFVVKIMKYDPGYQLHSNQIALYVMCPLLTIAAFRTRHTQNVSVLFVLCFLGMALANLDLAALEYRPFSSYVRLRYFLLGHLMLKAEAYFLMTIFALFSMRKIKKHLGGIVKWLWFVPFIVLLLGISKDGFYFTLLPFIRNLHANGMKYQLNPELLEKTAELLLILAVVFTGYAFRRICCKPAACAQSAGAYGQPESQYAGAAQARVSCPHCHHMNDADSVFCRNCGQQITAPAAQPQPEPPRPAPAPPVQPAQPKPAEPAAPQADPREMQKKMQAYKDLLECGILTQEEYDQKVSELKRG